MSSEFQKEMKEGESEKVFKVIIMAENAPNLEKT